jgi:hypothetical protein
MISFCSILKRTFEGPLPSQLMMDSLIKIYGIEGVEEIYKLWNPPPVIPPQSMVEEETIMEPARLPQKVQTS